MKFRTISSAILVVLFATFAASIASANTLTFTAPAPQDQQYQQTQNSPCVYGDTSCKQPAGFGETSIKGGGACCDEWGPNYQSLTYSYTQLFNALCPSAAACPGGTVGFIMGIDVNVADQTNPQLLSLNEYICTTNASLYTDASCSLASNFTSSNKRANGNNSNWAGCSTTSAQNGTDGCMVVANNGNGYADDILSGFTGVTANHWVIFTLDYQGANDGTEEFFLINQAAPPPAIPEPASMALFGSGLSLVAFQIRRRLGK